MHKLHRTKVSLLLDYSVKIIQTKSQIKVTYKQTYSFWVYQFHICFYINLKFLLKWTSPLAEFHPVDSDIEGRDLAICLASISIVSDSDLFITSDREIKMYFFRQKRFTAVKSTSEQSRWFFKTSSRRDWIKCVNIHYSEFYIYFIFLNSGFWTTLNYIIYWKINHRLSKFALYQLIIYLFYI